MRRIELVGLLVVAGVLAAAAIPVLNPALGVVFPPTKARELLHQCSRDAPQSVTGTWAPKPAEILQLEKTFPRAFRQAVTARGFDDRESLLRQMDQYARQYGGILIGARKLIYVNGFLAYRRDNDTIEPTSPAWRSRPVMVCDGGPSFFGVEYNPANDTFAHFAFNGVA